MCIILYHLTFFFGRCLSFLVMYLCLLLGYIPKCWNIRSHPLLPKCKDLRISFRPTGNVHTSGIADVDCGILAQWLCKYKLRMYL